MQSFMRRRKKISTGNQDAGFGGYLKKYCNKILPSIHRPELAWQRQCMVGGPDGWLCDGDAGGGGTGGQWKWNRSPADTMRWDSSPLHLRRRPAKLLLPVLSSGCGFRRCRLLQFSGHNARPRRLVMRGGLK